MTEAQAKALSVIASADGPVRGWKRRSVHVGEPLSRPWADKKATQPRVNYRAAMSLVDQKLVAFTLPRAFSRFAHDYTYYLRPAGIEEARQRGMLRGA